MLFALLISLSLWSPTAAEEGPCDRLRAQAEQIDTAYRKLRQRFESGQLKPEKYAHRLNKLRKKERKIHQKARDCTFEDQETYNYWYRGRLKFPTLVQQELDRLEREKKE